ncbi:formate dehydrogenase accessory sulfurtransferase FdhD [soil metagenome]
MSHSVIRWEDGTSKAIVDELAEEEPLEIRVRGRAISITMRTPGHDDELAAGFFLSEGIIHQRGDVLRIEPCAKNELGNTIDVLLAPEIAVDFGKLTRHVFASSSCGICGKATIDSVMQDIDRVNGNLVVDADLIARFPAIMHAAQENFHRTGGLHAAALFDSAGKMLVLREDVGRHNAVDKVMGHALLHDWAPLDQRILLVSGRSSFEIMQKSLAARIPIVAAVSAPSSLAVQFAEQSGQTLIGFLREGRMNIYTNGDRIRRT